MNSLITSLVAEFSRLIRQELTANQLIEVNNINASNGYNSNTCATHDYIDANEVLNTAFINVTGEGFAVYTDDIPEEVTAELMNKQTDIANKVWDIAKKAHFSL